jgi:hypothetical protein
MDADTMEILVAATAKDTKAGDLMRLFAAAPALLEACQKVKEQAGLSPDSPCHKAIVEAIKKAGY